MPAAVTTRTHHPDAPAVPAIATTRGLGDTFVGRRYLALVLVLGSLAAIGPLTVDAYLPALPQLTTDLDASAAASQATLTGLMVGLGLGQLVAGPLSDAYGRRRPLLVGLVGHAVMSLLCALAPTIGVLVVLRGLQGLTGAAVAVVTMAVVRDLFTGLRAAQLLSRLILVLGVAPILAPSLGSALLAVTSWRGIFVVLAVVAVTLLVVALRGLPETLPVERRMPATVAATTAAYRRLFADRTFCVLVVVAGLVFGTMFAYVAGSPFVLQETFGLDTAQFGLAFGLNAVGLIAMTQLNPVLVRRFAPVRVLTAGVLGALASAVVLLATTLAGFGGLLGFAVPLWLMIASIGLAMPNAPAVALSRHGESAGTAAALLGAAQFVIGGSVAPLVGALDDGTPVPLAAILVATTTAATALLLLVRGRLLAREDDAEGDRLPGAGQE